MVSRRGADAAAEWESVPQAAKKHSGCEIKREHPWFLYVGRVIELESTLDVLDKVGSKVDLHRRPKIVHDRERTPSVVAQQIK
jgi:hypothetical protein